MQRVHEDIVHFGTHKDHRGDFRENGRATAKRAAFWRPKRIFQPSIFSHFLKQRGKLRPQSKQGDEAVFDDRISLGIVGGIGIATAGARC